MTACRSSARSIGRANASPTMDTVELAGRLGGTECLVMGSDWPHAEGLREPADFYAKVEALGDDARRAFLRDNGLKLLGVT